MRWHLHPAESPSSAAETCLQSWWQCCRKGCSSVMGTLAHPGVLYALQTDTFEAVKVNVYNLIGELAVRLRGPQVGWKNC